MTYQWEDNWLVLLPEPRATITARCRYRAEAVIQGQVIGYGAWVHTNRESALAEARQLCITTKVVTDIRRRRTPQGWRVTMIRGAPSVGPFTDDELDQFIRATLTLQLQETDHEVDGT